MEKVELYRQVFSSFKELCAKGEQSCSFSAYCREHGVSSSQMRQVLKEEFQHVRSLPGYRSAGTQCREVYESFKALCIEGKQPRSFTRYYKSFGIRMRQMQGFMFRNKLKLSEIPGFVGLNGKGHNHVREIPFEDIIFEEAGFLPAAETSVITVSVNGHVAVSFPADTDVAVIAKFIKKMGKEAGHVES